jgi:uncharacterized membrane protein
LSNKEPAAIHVIIAFIFAGRKQALPISDDLKARGIYEAHNVIASTIVDVDDKGKAHVHEAGHGTRGTALGLVAGGLLGLVGGPAGLLLLAVAGGAIGGMAGRLGGRPIATEDLERLEAQMQPDTSAILVLVEDTQAEALSAAMAGYATKVVTLTVSGEVSEEIYEAMAIPGEKAETPGHTTGTPVQAAAIPGQAPAASEPPATGTVGHATEPPVQR